MNFLRTHHVVIIASNFQTSKDFYVRIPGLEVVAEGFTINMELGVLVTGGRCRGRCRSISTAWWRGSVSSPSTESIFDEPGGRQPVRQVGEPRDLL